MGIDTAGGHPDMDYNQHLATYKGFVRGTTAIVIILAVLLIGMRIFLI